jgi:hypothetical protein
MSYMHTVKLLTLGMASKVSDQGRFGMHRMPVGGAPTGSYAISRQDGLPHDGLPHDGLSHDGLSHDGLSQDGL